MRFIPTLINVFLPGVGTVFAGMVGKGLVQIVLYLFAALLTFTWVLGIIGIPLGFVVWIWSIYSTVKAVERKGFRDGRGSLPRGMRA